MSELKPLEPVVVPTKSPVEKISRVKDAESASKAIVHSFIIQRDMQFYPLTDSEFESIAYLNTEIGVLLAVAPTLAGIAVTAFLSLIPIDISTQPIA